MVPRRLGAVFALEVLVELLPRVFVVHLVLIDWRGRKPIDRAIFMAFHLLPEVLHEGDAFGVVDVVLVCIDFPLHKGCR